MPKINKNILVWARETAQLDLEDAARKLQFKDGKTATAAEKLHDYEDGKKDPSRSTLLNMSKLYRRPLLTFYLDQPPTIGDRGEDFRKFPDEFDVQENFFVDSLIREIKARQTTIREALIDDDVEIHLKFVGKNNVDQGVPVIVQTIRDILNFDLQEYRNQPNYHEAFKLLRQTLEDVGIFVLLKGNLGSYHTDISVEAFRGFALSDDIAPFIVINDKDSKAAWSFTLIHEMAHIILGQTGLSGAHAEKAIEKYCNEVASEFLLPSDEFTSFHLSNFEFENLIDEISEYAFSKKVSNTHISYRLYRRGDIEKHLWIKLRDFYKKKWREQRDTTKAIARQKDGGPSFYVLQRHRLGALAGLVEELTYSGVLTTTKAGMVLGVKPLKVHRLFDIDQPV